jgi:RNA polymerase sigma-70 factor (ECF subfamily)
LNEPPSYPEKELLLLVSEGDEIAFRTLYDRFRPKIYALGMFLTKTDVMAQEIVQDVFMKVWENRKQLRDIQYFNSWLKVVARNTASNYLRSQSIEKLALAHIAAQPAASNDEAGEREYAELLQKAVAQLPPQQQKVYIYHRQQGLQHEEIAQMMGISANSSRKYFKIALRSLRRHLESHLESIVLLAIALYLD